jgi:Putative transmembrane protein (Alph_Pro_TM)
MRSRAWRWLTVAWCLPLLLALALAGSVRAESVTLQLTPDVVEISSFYQGRNVALTGTLPAGLDAVVEVMGPTTEEHLMRKGRRGPLWMNVGQIKVDGAPSIYIVLTTAADLLGKGQSASSWGFPALLQHLSLSGDLQENEHALFKKQFLELKESQKLYAAAPGDLKLAPAGDGRQKITGKFWLPSNLKPDTYKVCLTTVREGQAVDRVCTDLPVQMVGFPAFSMTMAYQHAALYGLLAVLIAIVVGFIMGYLFKGGGGH